MPRDRFKTSPQMDAVSGVTYSHLPPSILNARRSHSSDRIFDIINEGDRYQLSPMPFIPYALALSLTTAYRKWRFSRTPMFRVRGKENFKDILPLLKELGKVWTSARINSNLGEMVMAHVSKAEQNIRVRTRKASPAAVGGAKPAQRRTQKPNRRALRAETGGSSSSVPEQPLVPEVDKATGPTPPNPGDAIFESPSTTTSAATLAEFSHDFGLMGDDSLGTEVFTGVDMDDTAFQSWSLTDAIDSCFISNLDPGYPFSWPPEYSTGY